jgi:DNA helicase-2/ATP-dependent DNA helicase PcrA
MRDRLSAAAQAVGYRGDLSELRVSTIHGLCNRILAKHRHRTALGNSYETLDELTQLLFIFEHFNEIIGPEENGLFLARWKTRWTAIEGARGYFDKITEELVDPEKLATSPESFTQGIARAYRAYETALFAGNRIDFAHLQSIVHGLLQQPEHATTIAGEIRYVLVDEYQDTNYVQEQLVSIPRRDGQEHP